MFVIILCLVNAGLAAVDVPNLGNATTKKVGLFLNETFFASLENYQVNATQVTEVKYPWIAKVIHSRVNNRPYMCTASCLRRRVFLTAARCILSLKIQQTRVIYQKTYFNVLSFVLPSQGTKQAYDDLGFIVTTDINFNNWPVISLYGATNRTDEAYQWFKQMPRTGLAVGYATTKAVYRIKEVDIPFNLTELTVKIGTDICKILNTRGKLRGYKVPCYHSCDTKQFKNNDTQCSKYHGVEGSAILDFKTKKLLGVSTWGPSHSNHELPAGLSVANSANFYEDYKCATKIANSKVSNMTSLQNICN